MSWRLREGGRDGPGFVKAPSGSPPCEGCHELRSDPALTWRSLPGTSDFDYEELS